RRPQHAADLLVDLQQVIEAEVGATRKPQAAAYKDADVFVLSDYLPAPSGDERVIDRDEESVLDLEFNDLCAAEQRSVDDLAPNDFADEPFIAAPTVSPVAPLSSELDVMESRHDEGE